MKEKNGLLCFMVAMMFIFSGQGNIDGSLDLELPILIEAEYSSSSNNSSMQVGNFSRGGYHLATGEWWEPSESINSKTFNNSDWDNDGVNNNADPFPFRHQLVLRNSTDFRTIGFSNPIVITNDTNGGELSPWSFDFDGDGMKEIAIGEELFSIKTDLNLEYRADINQAPVDHSQASELELIDLNQDGRMDIAGGSGVGIQTQNSSFQSYVYSGTFWWEFEDLQIIDAKDIDNDGDLDYSLKSDGYHYIVQNNNNSYSVVCSQQVASGHDTVQCEGVFFDFDNDSDFDVIGCDLMITESHGNGTYSLVTPSETFDELFCDLAVIPMANNSDYLLVDQHGGSGNWPPYESYLVKFSVNSDGSPIPSILKIPIPGVNSDNSREGCKEVAIYDINEDNEFDLVCGASPYVQVFTAKDGEIDNMPDYVLNTSIEFSGMTIMDYDEDGDGDLLLSTGTGVLLLLNGGSFISQTDDMSKTITVDEDIDPTDRDTDGWDEWGSCGEVNLSWDNLHMCTEGYSGIPSYEHKSDFGDMNSDGIVDLLSFHQYYVRISLNLSSPQIVMNHSSTYTGDALQNAKFIDIDGDGMLEIAVLNGSGNVQVFNWTLNTNSNESTLEFSLVQSFDAGFVAGGILCGGNSDSYCEIEVRDINDDGLDDLVTLGGQRGIRLFLSNGSSISTTPFWSNSTTKPIHIDLKDFNLDGISDPAITYSDRSSVVYYSSNSTIPTFPSWTSGVRIPIQIKWVKVSDSEFGLFIGVSGIDEIRCVKADMISDICWESSDSVDTLNAFMLKQSVPDVTYLIRITSAQVIASPFKSDYDSDHVLDEEDVFLFDPTQSVDSDDDGYGDEFQGRMYDSCVGDWGDSWRDRWGCPDLDKDGQSDLFDDYINKPTQWKDSDGDGLGDNWADTSLNNSRLPHWPGQWIEDAYNPDPSPLDFDNDLHEDEHLEHSQGPLDECPYTYGTSLFDRFGCIDSDSDGYSDPDSGWTVLNGADRFPSDQTQWEDADGDGWGDNSNGLNPDIFPADPTQWSDFDLDGYGDNSTGTDADQFPLDDSQWYDSDGDGYGDNPAPAMNPDACPTEAGTSTKDGLGCPDPDDDGWGLTDACPSSAGNSSKDMIGCSDVDGDGWSDVGDFDPNDSAIWSDGDGDGFPDQGGGDDVDACPGEFGTSRLDRNGCLDEDGDGWSSADGAWFLHPLGSADSHPEDPTQWRDRDGDGYGDNQTGTDPDSCPDLSGSSRWRDGGGMRVSYLGCADADGDGYEDDTDDCPTIAGASIGISWGCPDSDDDGYQDVDDDCPSQSGTSSANLKACPDSDGDGIADLEDPLPLMGLNGTATANDWDGDSHNNSMDDFPFDETQWLDSDGDGLGDEPDGRNPDPFPFDKDNDGWDDPADLSIDELGCLLKTETGKDAFPDDPREWKDSDGDCIGDNADSDDDNDGYSDVEELQAGTDSFSSESRPVESFEVVLPGTTIGLGAWDLIGMFAGIPLALWIMTGLVTRGARTRRFERRLFEATSEEGLSEISDDYEWSLMWRMIGPHQALRLERIRSNLEFKFNQIGTESIDHTVLVESSTPDPSMTGVVGTDGYEWIDHGGAKWYRAQGFVKDWTRWN